MNTASSPASTFTPTPQQVDIFDSVGARFSTIVTARAGCGKTSTLAKCAHQALPSTLRGCYLAFNVKVKKEAEGKFPANFTCLTINGLGHRAWQSGRPRLRLYDGRDLPRKDRTVVEDYLAAHKLTATWDERRELAAILNSARMACLVPHGMPGVGFTDDNEEGWQQVFAKVDADWKEDTLSISRGILRDSIAWAGAGKIDFADQIYMPVCFGGNWPSFDVLFGDEAQDFSQANMKMLRLVRAPQKVLVGDPKQAIYAFRGAMADSMDHLESCMPADTEWRHLFLTKTFRCGKAIVARQQPFCPDFEAAETNPEGEILYFPHHPDMIPMNNRDEQIEMMWTPAMVPNGSAILCRNNAPLIKCALAFLRAGRKVAVLGRDFGESLRRDIKKATKDAPASLPITPVHEAIKAYYEKKISGEGKTPTEEELAAIQDRVEAVIALSEGCKTLGDLYRRIEDIFSDEKAPVTLSTGHKAKGMEWDWVMHLNPFLIPSRWSQDDPVQLQQEHNLAYVIETRPKETLVLANLEDLEA